MLFFVRFDVTQPANVSNKDLVETWIREAEAAVGAMDAGAVPHLWKVAGQRVVLAAGDLPTPGRSRPGGMGGASPAWTASSPCRAGRIWTGRWAGCRSSARWARA